MKLFQVSFTTIIARFYLVMLIVLAAGFTGYWMIGILALPVFFSALMGVRFNPKRTITKTQTAAQKDVQHATQQHPAHI